MQDLKIPLDKKILCRFISFTADTYKYLLKHAAGCRKDQPRQNDLAFIIVKIPPVINSTPEDTRCISMLFH